MRTAALRLKAGLWPALLAVPDFMFHGEHGPHGNLGRSKSRHPL